VFRVGPKVGCFVLGQRPDGDERPYVVPHCSAAVEFDADLDGRISFSCRE